jgi:hypothetical protein
MRAADFVRHVRDTDSPLNELCAKYAHAFLVMTSQTAACNRLHPLNERLCRWLKLVHNRLRRDEFPIRQEFMAMMLGAWRLSKNSLRKYFNHSPPPLAINSDPEIVCSF